MFVQDISGNDLELPPKEKKLKKSQCTPLFMCAYTRRNAGAVIHTHSKFAVMITLHWPGKEFRVTHLEMIKGTIIYTIRMQFFIYLGKYINII